MTVPERKAWRHFKQKGRIARRKFDQIFDWSQAQSLVRDPLLERCALGLLALITALLLFKARVPIDQGKWIEALDANMLLLSAGSYGLFFTIWFTALLLVALFCPRNIRDNPSRDRALEAHRKATDHSVDSAAFSAFVGYYDADNLMRPGVRGITALLFLSSVLAFFSSLALLVSAIAPILR